MAAAETILHITQCEPCGFPLPDVERLYRLGGEKAIRRAQRSLDRLCQCLTSLDACALIPVNADEFRVAVGHTLDALASYVKLAKNR